MNREELFERYKPIVVPKIVLGKAFNAVPHYIAPAKGNLSETPVFCLEDMKENRYVAYLRGLNKKDVKPDREYKMIVRGLGSLESEICVAFLEERVEIDNLIHVQAEEKHDTTDKLVGKFMHYQVFIDNFNILNEVDVEKGNYIFGKAYHIGGREKCFIDLMPISVVSEERYLKHKNRIFR
ncbi:MAG: hypothetical protein WC781_00575 [Candidatus Pacearchaeota archaeon]